MPHFLSIPLEMVYALKASHNGYDSRKRFFTTAFNKCASSVK